MPIILSGRKWPTRGSKPFYRFTNLLTFGAQISELLVVYIESSKIGLEVTRYTASGHSNGCIAVAFSGYSATNLQVC